MEYMDIETVKELDHVFGCIKYRAVGPEQQKPDRVDKMQDQGTGQYHEENEASGDPVFGGQH